ncbi:MAG: hypothetical protein AAGC90_00550 [Curtobacterium sp.]
MVRKRKNKRDEFLLDHKDVPFITSRVKDSALPFLPDRSRAPLDAAAVERFVSLTAADPDTRMAVLGVLRTHAANGAEVVLSATALLISVAGVVLAATRIDAGGGLGVLISVAEAAALFGVVLWVLRRAGAAHIRKLTALVWLGAYEDALRLRSRPWKRLRRHR